MPRLFGFRTSRWIYRVNQQGSVIHRIGFCGALFLEIFSPDASRACLVHAVARFWFATPRCLYIVEVRGAARGGQLGELQLDRRPSRLPG